MQPANWRNSVGFSRLAIVVAVVAALWGVALPKLAHSPAAAAHIALMQDRGVDPSAKFYTELDAMPRVLAEMDRAYLADRGAWWKPSRWRRPCEQEEESYMGPAGEGGGAASGTRAVGVRLDAGSQ